MRIFGWMRESEHEEIWKETVESMRSSWERLVGDLKTSHQNEVNALRGEIVDMRNKLAAKDGAAVAEAHAQGKPAPKRKS